VNDVIPATTAVDAQNNDPSSVSLVDFVADVTASAVVALPPTVPGPVENPRLTSEELTVWLPLLRLADLLPQALDRFLREHTGIGHSYHEVLVLLSAAPDQRLRMSELAAATRTSKSRLSHAVACLEERGLVSRRSDTTDGRGRIARLTPAGRRFLDQTAPYHATAARRLAFDHLGPDEVEQLRTLTAKLLDGAPTALLLARSLAVSPETEAPSCPPTRVRHAAVNGGSLPLRCADLSHRGIKLPGIDGALGLSVPVTAPRGHTPSMTPPLSADRWLQTASGSATELVIHVATESKRGPPLPPGLPGRAGLDQPTSSDCGRPSNGLGKAARHADVTLPAVKGFSLPSRSSKSASAALAICSFRSRCSRTARSTVPGSRPRKAVSNSSWACSRRWCSWGCGSSRRNPIRMYRSAARHRVVRIRRSQAVAAGASNAMWNA
jgi:DNA-binding MarR family transcriptional regulator